MRKYKINYELAKKRLKMGSFCTKCGEIGGHYDNKCPLESKNKKCCRNCGSHLHDNRKSDDCSFWTGLAILTLFYNEYYSRNKKIGKRYITNSGELNAKWILKDFEINTKINERN